MLLAIFTDLIQDLFDPVAFGTEVADETRAYMMFTRYLTEAEGIDTY